MMRKVDPKVKDVLKLLAAGTLLVSAFLMPGTALLLKAYVDSEKRKELAEWERFNAWRLKQVLKRLQKQKVIEIVGDEIRITSKGKKKLLKFDLYSLELKKKRDGFWRLIVYDIQDLKKEQRELFRSILKRLQFLQLQRSVYLTPYVCDEEIEYLRQLFEIGNEVVVLRVSDLENEEVFEKYFGL